MRASFVLRVSRRGISILATIGLVAGLLGFVVPSTGVATGTVVGWGRNDFGQADVPTGLSHVAAIAAGGLHSLALKDDGTVVGWGYDLYGQADVPAGLSHVKAISAGG